MNRESRASFAPSLLAVGAAAGLFATAGIHLDLYVTGYHAIPTIGPLFLLQIITAFALGFAVLLVRKTVVSLSGGMFSLSTLGGYLLSRAFGLFGFHEVRTTAGIVAGMVEIATFVLLGTLTLLLRAPHDATASSSNAVGRLIESLSPFLRLSIVPLALASVALLFSAEYAASNGPGATTSAHSSASTPGPRIVIRNLAFIPPDITVKPGTTVTVTNDDSVAHTLTAMPGSSLQGKFNTGDINPSASATFVAPTEPGTYRYYCSIHNFMTGVVTVS